MRNLNALTRREKQVAELVELGFTNPRIAETLGISRNTVKSHISHIRAKLDITGGKKLADVLNASFGLPSTSPPKITTWQPWK